VLALSVFSQSVVWLPMLLHRKGGFTTALVTSFMATKLGFAVMPIWDALIASRVLIGMATDFIAMAAFPHGWGMPAGMPGVFWSSWNNNLLASLVANNQDLPLRGRNFSILLQAR
jgi:hypothetical protein